MMYWGSWCKNKRRAAIAEDAIRRSERARLTAEHRTHSSRFSLVTSPAFLLFLLLMMLLLLLLLLLPLLLVGQEGERVEPLREPLPLPRVRSVEVGQHLAEADLLRVGQVDRFAKDFLSCVCVCVCARR
jgi:hypothetical protein